MIRTFVAIALSDDVKRDLAVIAQKVMKMGLDGSFTKPDSVHLTLKFLGNIEETRVDAIGEALTKAAAGIPVLRIQCRRVGVFPGPASPRVVWVGIEAVPELTDLQRRIDDELEILGFPREDRPFSPHLTLARLKGRANIRILQDYLQKDGGREQAGSFSASEVHLFRSDLRPDGALYTKLRSVTLGSLPPA